jgi:hypothetical protein
MDNSIYGQQSTLSATDSALHINIEDQIVKYPDLTFPLLKRWGSKVFKAEVKSHKYEWSERESRPTKATVASATVAADATTFYVDTSGVFNVDDVLRKPDGEQVIVTAVSGGTLLTVKAWTGTPETMVLGETVVRVGVASPQGKDADDMVIQGSTDLFNYTQIFEDVVHLSGTQRNALIRGDESQADLIERKHKELAEVLQNSLILGVRNVDVADKRYSLGGLKYFVDTYAPQNVVNFGGSWTTDATVIDKFEDAVELIALNGGAKPTIYMGYKALRKLRNVQDDVIFGGRKDKERGIGVVNTYLSGMGELDIVQLIDRSNLFNDMIFLVDESKVGYKAMRNRGWFTEELAKVGDSYKWQVLGEYTVKVETPKIMSYMYNLGL